MDETKVKPPERIEPLIAALGAANPEASTAVVEGRKSAKNGNTTVEISFAGGEIVMSASIVKTLDGGSLLALYAKLAQGVLEELEVDAQFAALESALGSPDGSFTYELASIREGRTEGVHFEQCSISTQASGEDHTIRITLRLRATASALENLVWMHELESIIGSVKLSDAKDDTVRNRFAAAVRAVELIVFEDEPEAVADPLQVEGEGDGEVPENEEDSPPVHPVRPAASAPAEEDSAPAPPKPTISAALQQMIDEIDLRTEMIPNGDLLDEALALQKARVTILKHPAEGDAFEVTVDGALGKVKKKLGKLPTVTRSRSRLDDMRAKRGGKRKKKGDEE